MTLENRDELRAALGGDVRLGWVFARHAYGMAAWVDLFTRRLPGIADPGLRDVVAGIVADNARHERMFRERAIAHGIDPDAYACPDEGEAIYDRLDALEDTADLVGYALGSLDHFEELLSVYAAAADGDDAATIAAVRADNTRARAVLRGIAGPDAVAAAAEAHELYRVRELVETELYGRREAAHRGAARVDG